MSEHQGLLREIVLDCSVADFHAEVQRKLCPGFHYGRWAALQGPEEAVPYAQWSPCPLMEAVAYA